MIIIDNILISEEIVEEQFVCDLNACKGACCVEGESGAPLDDEELKLLPQAFEAAKEYMTPEGIKTIEEQGLYTDDKGWKTPLVGGKGGPCAYVNYDDNGITYCSIEKAWSAGKTAFRKPVSCHLYPIRINKTHDVEFVNYDEWDICDPACKLGASLKVPVYKFTKEALIRKYGQEFYDTLEATIEYMKTGGEEE